MSGGGNEGAGDGIVMGEKGGVLQNIDGENAGEFEGATTAEAIDESPLVCLMEGMRESVWGRNMMRRRIYTNLFEEGSQDHCCLKFSTNMSVEILPRSLLTIFLDQFKT